MLSKFVKVLSLSRMPPSLVFSSQVNPVVASCTQPPLTAENRAGVGAGVGLGLGVGDGDGEGEGVGVGLGVTAGEGVSASAAVVSTESPPPQALSKADTKSALNSGVFKCFTAYIFTSLSFNARRVYTKKIPINIIGIFLVKFT